MNLNLRAAVQGIIPKTFSVRNAVTEASSEQIQKIVKDINLQVRTGDVNGLKKYMNTAQFKQLSKNSDDLESIYDAILANQKAMRSEIPDNMKAVLKDKAFNNFPSRFQDRTEILNYYRARPEIIDALLASPAFKKLVSNPKELDNMMARNYEIMLPPKLRADLIQKYSDLSVKRAFAGKRIQNDPIFHDFIREKTNFDIFSKGITDPKWKKEIPDNMKALLKGRAFPDFPSKFRSLDDLVNFYNARPEIIDALLISPAYKKLVSNPKNLETIITGNYHGMLPPKLKGDLIKKYSILWVKKALTGRNIQNDPYFIYFVNNPDNARALYKEIMHSKAAGREINNSALWKTVIQNSGV